MLVVLPPKDGIVNGLVQQRVDLFDARSEPGLRRTKIRGCCACAKATRKVRHNAVGRSGENHFLAIRYLSECAGSRQHNFAQCGFDCSTFRARCRALSVSCVRSWNRANAVLERMPLALLVGRDAANVAQHPRRTLLGRFCIVRLPVVHVVGALALG